MHTLPPATHYEFTKKVTSKHVLCIVKWWAFAEQMFSKSIIFIGRVGKMPGRFVLAPFKAPESDRPGKFGGAQSGIPIAESKPIKSINWPTARLSAERMRGNAARISHRE
jgi:hypothetical protein